MFIAVLLLTVFAVVFFGLAALPFAPVERHHPRLIALGALCLSIVLLIHVAHGAAPP